MYALILSLLMALPGVGIPHDGESVDAHRVRLGVAAYSILSAANQATCSDEWAKLVDCQRIWPGSRDELVLALVTVGFHESRFLGRIQAGKCRKDECDAYKDALGRVQHRSRTYYQIQQTGAVTSDEWREMVGTEVWPTFVATSVAARVLSTARTACARHGAWPAPTFSRYGTGASCAWGRVGSRVSTYKKAEQMFRSFESGAKALYSDNDGTPLHELTGTDDAGHADRRSRPGRVGQTRPGLVDRHGGGGGAGLPGQHGVRRSRQGASEHRAVRNHGVAQGPSVVPAVRRQATRVGLGLSNVRPQTE